MSAPDLGEQLDKRWLLTNIPAELGVGHAVLVEEPAVARCASDRYSHLADVERLSPLATDGNLVQRVRRRVVSLVAKVKALEPVVRRIHVCGCLVWRDDAGDNDKA